MTAAELACCRVHEDPTSAVMAEGYVMAFLVFYEWAFDVLSHQFLCSLLQYYGLELHILAPSGILQIMAFVTLCEAFMGIDHHFNLLNHFFHVQLP
jgi:hypothetical protein